MKRLSVAIFLGLVVSPAYACIFGLDGFFVCAEKAEMTAFAQEHASKGYLRFLEEISKKDTNVESYKHKKIKNALEVLQPNPQYPKKVDQDEFLKRSLDWFIVYCSATSGTVKDKKNLAYVCVPKSDPSGAPLAGIQLNRSVYKLSNFANPYTLKSEHFGDADSVKMGMGILKDFKLGDETNMGMVIEVKPPLAKIQAEQDGKIIEKWVKIDELQAKLAQ